MNKTLVEKANSLCKDCGISKNNLTKAINIVGGRVADDSTDETEIDKVANEVLEIAKVMQAEATSRVEDYKQKHPSQKQNVKTPVNDDDANNDDDDAGSNNNSVASLVEAALAKALKPLQDKLALYEKNDAAKTRLEALTEKLNGCKDEQFKTQTLKDFKRMSFESDDAFNEYLTEKASDIETANQNFANSKLAGGNAPMFSQKEENGVSSAVAAFVKSKEKSEDDKFAGKKLI